MLSYTLLLKSDQPIKNSCGLTLLTAKVKTKGTCTDKLTLTRLKKFLNSNSNTDIKD